MWYRMLFELIVLGHCLVRLDPCADVHVFLFGLLVGCVPLLMLFLVDEQPVHADKLELVLLHNLLHVFVCGVSDLIIERIAS